MGMATRDEDVLEKIVAANTLDHLLVFSNLGKVYSLRTYQLPQGDRTGRGLPINALLPFYGNERVTALLAVPGFEADGYFTMCTRQGRIKRVEFEEFASVRPSGLIAMSLDEGDELGWVRHTTGNDDLILVTRDGQSIRFNENDVRVMGRPAAGVNAMRLQDDDILTGMDVITVDHVDACLLIVTEKGYGKRVPVSEFRTQGRYGSGVRAIGSDMEKTGKIVGAMLTDGSEDVTAITVNGITLRTYVDNINTYSRMAMGVNVMKLGKKDRIVSITLLQEDEDEGQVEQPLVSGNGHEQGDLEATEPLEE
jgi:DNA gyrase subunit A